MHKHRFKPIYMCYCEFICVTYLFVDPSTYLPYNDISLPVCLSITDLTNFVNKIMAYWSFPSCWYE